MRSLIVIFLTSLALLVPVLAADPAVAVEVLAKSDKMWNGTSLPDFTNKETEVTILRITIPAHAEIPMHKHPVINAGYLLSGRLTVMSEAGAVLNMKAGDTLIELVDQWHMGRNDGDEPAVIVVFYVGTVGDTLAIKQTATDADGH